MYLFIGGKCVCGVIGVVWCVGLINFVGLSTFRVSQVTFDLSMFHGIIPAFCRKMVTDQSDAANSE